MISNPAKTVKIIIAGHFLSLNTRLFNHPAQYLTIQIIRRYLGWVQAHTFIFSRLGFSQLEGNTVDGGCRLIVEVYFPRSSIHSLASFWALAFNKSLTESIS